MPTALNNIRGDKDVNTTKVCETSCGDEISSSKRDDDNIDKMSSSSRRTDSGELPVLTGRLSVDDDITRAVRDTSESKVIVNPNVENGPLDNSTTKNAMVVELGEDEYKVKSAYPVMEKNTVVENVVLRSVSRESIAVAKLDSQGRFDTFSNLTLTWTKINVSADVTTGCLSKKVISEKRILKGVNGIVEPGQFVAIMGASGAGKTTLLNTLAFRNEAKLKMSGSIKANGLDITNSQLKLISSYVQQEDCFIGTLTVKEVMMFHANLRMDRSYNKEEKEKRVDAILIKLGLTKVKDSLCGYPGGLIRGISGGERKRLSVATEMLMDPPLLFIDEPTSGLDSFMAQSIVKLIGKLASANRTILCTIHQPTSEVFALFDRVCLMAEGQVAYLGKSEDCLEHFNKAGFPCPKNFNPADHYIFTLAIQPGSEDKCRQRCKELTEYYESSQDYEAVRIRIREVEFEQDKKDINLSRQSILSSPIQQCVTNFKRSFFNTVRNPTYTRVRVFQELVIGIVAGLVYYSTDHDKDELQNKSGVFFFLVTSLTFSNIFLQASNIPLELPVIKREYQNGMYSTLPYLMCKVLCEIPFIILMPLCQMTVCYFLIGLRNTAEAFFTSVAACVGVCFAATGLGFFISALAGDLRIASAIASPFIMPFLLFGGLFQNSRSARVYGYPFKYASWLRYGFNMLMLNEYKNTANATEVFAHFDLKENHIWWPNFAALLLIGAVGILLAWPCLICKVRR